MEEDEEEIKDIEEEEEEEGEEEFEEGYSFDSSSKIKYIDSSVSEY